MRTDNMHTDKLAVRLFYRTMFCAGGPFSERMQAGRRAYHHALRTANLPDATPEEVSALIEAYLAQRPATQCAPGFSAPSQAFIKFQQPSCQRSLNQRDSAG